MADTPNPLEETLLAEYAAAQDDYLHNDNFPWQIGSILIVGTFVFWGLLLDKQSNPQILGISSALVTLLLSVWILYAHHYRQTYLCKLHRLQEIERILGMESHTRWAKNKQGDKRPVYRTFGPSGHNMNLFIYCTACLGTPLIELFNVGLSWWLTLPLPIIFVVVVWININERQIKKLLAAQK
jgi:hypothetical protein